MVSDVKSIRRAPPISSQLTLDTDLTYVKGVGPYKANFLKTIGITTVSDLVFYFPRAHQDRRILKIDETIPGKKAALKVQVLSAHYRQVGKQLGQLRVVSKSERVINLLWFKHLSYKYDPFQGLKKIIQPGAWLYVYGTLDQEDGVTTMRVDDCARVDALAQNDPLWNGIVPQYSTCEGISEKWLKELVARVVPSVVTHVLDAVPEHVRVMQGLTPLSEAIYSYHFPKDWTSLGKARDRLAFDELFFLEIALELSRLTREKNQKGFSCVPTKSLLTPFKNNLGFAFTPSQVKVINEIFKDMSLPRPMYRLLQGDVGAGKTCVALSAALLAIENKRQVAILAPTEILAEQHYITFEKYLKKLPLRFGLMKGSLKTKERKKVLAELLSGDIDLIVGTHAILADDVEFKKLGLVVIDEQHRFGVKQRSKLVEKQSAPAISRHTYLEAHQPDVLVMTATPIPRSLAMTLYGDLDVSIMEALPSGRSPIVSSLVSESSALEKVKESLRRGEQVYYVLPFVEESEKLIKKGKNVKSVLIEAERIKALFPTVSLGLLHGQMASLDKKKIMDDFRSGQTQMLVCTPVIEVGIDVPSATTIVIMNAERFGLAQLHQLRGRVGRGHLPSACYLVSELNENETRHRLQMFCATTNGFTLAEEDLKMRGPGEIFGEAQHGLPTLRVANIVSDALLLSQAKNAAGDIVRGNAKLSLHEYMTINSKLKHIFGDRINLFKIG